MAQMRRIHKLTSAEAKNLVSSSLAARVETLSFQDMLPGFEVAMHRLYGRAPTDGERDLFAREFAKLLTQLRHKGKRAEELLWG